MEEFTTDGLGAWEGEGGAAIDPRPLSGRIGPVTMKNAMTGTVNQVEWAERIRERVSKEFDRVAGAMNLAASKQVGQNRTDTQTVLAILEDKRAGVMATERAGYFIHDWQELRDQVRQMIVQDPRYLAIKTNQAARSRTAKLKSSLSSL